jgi:hypothetical protein
MSEADQKFSKVQVELFNKHGAWVLSVGETVKEETDDIDDYGEPEVIKDLPKTKSTKLGMW